MGMTLSELSIKLSVGYFIKNFTQNRAILCSYIDMAVYRIRLSSVNPVHSDTS